MGIGIDDGKPFESQSLPGMRDAQAGDAEIAASPGTVDMGMVSADAGDDEGVIQFAF
jgi:hypothetical protein